MKRMRILGLALVAVFAVAAVGASGAMAASPEYKTCVKAANPATEGEYTTKTCETGTELAGAKYKLAGFNEGKGKLKLKGKGKLGVNVQYVPGTGPIGDTECSSEKVAGEVVSSKSAKIVTSYKGCKTNEGKNCETPGDGKGKIHTENLVTTLIPQPGAAEGIGIVVSPESGKVLAHYVCEGIDITATGGVIGEVTGGGTKAAVKTQFDTFRHSNVPGEAENFQAFAYFGANELQSAEKLGEFFASGGKTTPPDALISSTVKNAPPPAPAEFTAPATQNNETTVKGEAFKIV